MTLLRHAQGDQNARTRQNELAKLHILVCKKPERCRISNLIDQLMKLRKTIWRLFEHKHKTQHKYRSFVFIISYLRSGGDQQDHVFNGCLPEFCALRLGDFERCKPGGTHHRRWCVQYGWYNLVSKNRNVLFIQNRNCDFKYYFHI